MKDNKHNSSFARLIIVLGTFAAGLGIWLAVNHVSGTASGAGASAQDVSTTNPNFNTSDTFLNQPQLQQAPTVQGVPARTPRFRTRGS